ncbi:25388_t:CDS:2, partial [Gigaspora rosea]
DMWYKDKKLGNYMINTILKQICQTCNIKIEGRNIINYSGCTISITHLYQLGTPNSTLMSITSYKSESSVRIYLHPSEQQKKDCLSAIINSSINNIKTNPNIQAFESNNYDNIEPNNKNNIESDDHDNIELNDYNNLESNGQDNES